MDFAYDDTLHGAGAWYLEYKDTTIYLSGDNNYAVESYGYDDVLGEVLEVRTTYSRSDSLNTTRREIFWDTSTEVNKDSTYFDELGREVRSAGWEFFDGSLFYYYYEDVLYYSDQNVLRWSGAYSERVGNEQNYRSRQYFPSSFVTTGVVPERPELSVSLYPNPTQGPLAVMLPHAGRSDLRVLSMQGQLLWQQQGHHQTESISLGHLPPGMYLLQIRQGGKSTTRKIHLAR